MLLYICYHGLLNFLLIYLLIFVTPEVNPTSPTLTVENLSSRGGLFLRNTPLWRIITVPILNKSMTIVILRFVKGISMKHFVMCSHGV